MVEPWQTAEIPGPTKASVITKPEVVTAMLKRTERKVMVIGHQVTEIERDGDKPLELVIRISRTAKIPVVATGHTLKTLLERKHEAYPMSAVEIGSRLVDPFWKGLDGKGPYDLVLFLGLPYYMEWLVLSGLKHFSENLKSISLDRYYQPHASWSFPNILVEDWMNSLEAIARGLGGK